jgi:hypothetical protein
VLVAAAAIFTWRCIAFGGYFAEDAYITLRFARNLAEGYGLVWNPGGDPVEGFTSLLHVLILAIGIVTGVGARLAALAIGVASVAGLAWLFVIIVRREAGTFTPIAALVLAFYLVESRLAVHATAGLDTVMFMFMLAAALLVSIRFIERPSSGRAAALALIDLGCLLTRPDAAPYVAGQSAVLIVVAVYRRARTGESELLKSTAAFGVILIGAGVAYLGLKYAYFGYLLPNPFYIKSNDFTSFFGLRSVARFGLSLAHLTPFVLAMLLVDRRRLIEWWRRPNSSVKAALILVPPALFGAFLTTVLPEVNYLNRFEYPAYFFVVVALALLLSIGGAFERLDAWLSSVSPRLSPIVTGIACAGLLAFCYVATRLYFPWFGLVETGYYRPIGEALASSGLGPRASVVIDSAGVVPYVSRFAHIDPVGLTDNVLSGRRPITPVQREEYIWGRRPDVYIGPELPATAGAASCGGDPLIGIAYVQDVLLDPDRYRVSGYTKSYGHLTKADRCDLLHSRMRQLRDHYEYLGELPFPEHTSKGYTTFAYVRADSPHRRELEQALGPLFTNGPGIAGPPKQIPR